MPRLLIAGVPQALFHKHRSYRPLIPGWEIRVVPSRSTRRVPDAKSSWAEALREADDASDEEGTHILGFHDTESDRPAMEEVTGRRHRVIWASRGEIDIYGTEGFTTVLETYLSFEEQWRATARPTLNSPVLLPELSFCPKQGHQDLWRRVARVSKDSNDTLERVSKRIQVFRRDHRLHDAWKDINEILFKREEYHAGFQMGVAERRKYTLLTPLGFHFNVRHDRSRAFALHTQEGTVKVNEGSYTNVDCHGRLRQ